MRGSCGCEATHSQIQVGERGWEAKNLKPSMIAQFQANTVTINHDCKKQRGGSGIGVLYVFKIMWETEEKYGG